ncbi:hypothetical protein KAU45_01520 [bacterium]|nr:hypothetical protein [bacterium]
MRLLCKVALCLLLLIGLAAAETILLQPGSEGKDAEIDNKQGGTPHGNTAYILNYVGG